MTYPPAVCTETNRKIISQAFDAWHQGTGAITDAFAARYGLAYRGTLGRIEGVRQQAAVHR